MYSEGWVQLPHHKLQLANKKTLGIFPREPKNKRKANKGSSAPTSFYYAKDVAYLAHEPVLQRLREHKAFAKKLSRALGRGEWSSAKSLEENKPVYQLDHIIKERYIPVVVPPFLCWLVLQVPNIHWCPQGYWWRSLHGFLVCIFTFGSTPSTRTHRELCEAIHGMATLCHAFSVT